MTRKLDDPFLHQPLDAYAREVPDRLKDTFRGRWVMRDLCLRLEFMRSELRMMQQETYAADMDVIEICGFLEAARVKIMQATPFQPCDCHAWETDCQKCRGLQWVSMKSLLKQRPALRVG
jgi:hypothetical protein